MRITTAPTTKPIIRAVDGMLETASGDSEMEKKAYLFFLKKGFHKLVVTSVTQNSSWLFPHFADCSYANCALFRQNSCHKHDTFVGLCR